MKAILRTVEFNYMLSSGYHFCNIRELHKELRKFGSVDKDIYEFDHSMEKYCFRLEKRGEFTEQEEFQIRCLATKHKRKD